MKWSFQQFSEMMLTCVQNDSCAMHSAQTRARGQPRNCLVNVASPGMLCANSRIQPLFREHQLVSHAHAVSPQLT